VYVVYCRTGQVPLGKLYDAGWGSEETNLADYATQKRSGFSAVAIGDNVHFVYTKVSPYQIRHNERIWGVGWNASDVLVQDSVPIETDPALSATSDGRLYCFWALTDDHVYYKKYYPGWDVVTTDWIDESTEGIQYDWLCSSFYMDYGEYIGLLYTTKIASPYNVKFSFFMTTNKPPNAPTLNSPANNSEFEPSVNVNISWIFGDPDDGDNQSAYMFQLSNSADFKTTINDTNKFVSSNEYCLIDFPEQIDVYYVRVKTWDESNSEGPWSSTLFVEVAPAETEPGWTPGSTSPSTPEPEVEDVEVYTPNKTANIGIILIVGTVVSALLWNEIGGRKKSSVQGFSDRKRKPSKEGPKGFGKKGKKQEGPKNFKRKRR